MKRRYVVGAAASVLAAPAAAHAQEAAVLTGRVVSDRGQNVAGATVAIPELNVGTLTNTSGGFTLTVPAARVRGQSVALVVRFIGFRPERRQITLAAGRQALSFSLVTDASRLTEVVVTGVSTATEQVRVPFTVQRIDTTQTPVVGTNAISQLQGKVPGANIVSASGRPGAAPSVVLRGPSSINGQGRSQSPLYIVDGLFINGGIQDLNPADIESVEIVKGAAAANLYGERAGQGVINITTKSGRNAAAGIRFGVKAEGGTGDIPHEFSIARNNTLGTDPTSQFICARVQTNGSLCTQLVDLGAETRRVNEVVTPSALTPTSLLGDFGIGNAASYGYLTGQFQTGQYNQTRNVLGQFTTANGFSNSNVDVRGHVGSTGIYGSVSNLTNQGSIRYLGGYYRNAVRANIDQRFGDQVTLTLNTFYSTQRSYGDNQDANNGLSIGNGANAFFRITRTPAFADLTQRDAQGRLYVRSNVLAQGEQNANPLYDVANNSQAAKGNRFLGGSTLRYTPAEWVTLDATFGYDRGTGDQRLVNDLGFRTTLSNPAINNGALGAFSADSESINSQLTATFQRELFKDFRASLTGRYIYEQQTASFNSLAGSNLVVPNLATADAITDQNSKSISTGQQTVRGVAYVAATQLDFKDRYLIQANIRRGGSSLFGRNNRWANFPGISGSWIVSREPWWIGGNALSLLKLRGAYGETGNRPSFVAQYATFTIGAGGLLTPSQLGNPNLRPEVRRETEVGIDAEFFRRYNLNLTYAVNNTVDQILPVPLAFGSGFSTQFQNAGTLKNGSFEASLDLPFKQSRNFSWSGRVIYDRLRSRITQLNVQPYFTGFPTLQGAETIYRIAAGEPFGTIYGRDFARSCGQLPANFRSQCSGNGGDANAAFRPNSDGYIVWVGQGNQLGDGVTRNLWRARLPGAQAPYGDVTALVASGYMLNWGMPILLRDQVTGNPAQLALGQTLPNYRFGVSQSIRYKKLSVYGLLDASIGGKIWNEGYHWSLGDFMTGNNDLSPNASLETSKPIGYYWRAGPGLGGNTSGVGGFYDVLGPNRETVEDASYAKLREFSLRYNVGRLGPIRGNWDFGVVGRNLFMITRGYRGFDPEVGVTGGTVNSSALSGIDRFVYPNLRTFTFQLSTVF